MNCPRCGKPVGWGASFCMHCGQMLAQPSLAAPGSPPAPAPAVRRASWIGVALGLSLAAVAVLGLNAAGVLKLRMGENAPGSLKSGSAVSESKVLAGEGEMRVPNALRAQGQSGPPTLPSEANVKVMPAEVRRWLEHLERIERRRIALTESQLVSAMATITALQLGGTMSDLDALLQGDLDAYEPTKTAPTLEKTGSELESMKSEWSQLTADFNGLKPPAECLPIRDEYDQVVRETGAMIMDISTALEKAASDRNAALQALFSMRGKSAEKIGRPAESADDLVRQLCEKYATRKWFSIAKDVGGGGLLGGRMGF